MRQKLYLYVVDVFILDDASMWAEANFNKPDAIEYMNITDF